MSLGGNQWSVSLLGDEHQGDCAHGDGVTHRRQGIWQEVVRGQTRRAAHSMGSRSLATRPAIR